MQDQETWWVSLTSDSHAAIRTTKPNVFHRFMQSLIFGIYWMSPEGRDALWPEEESPEEFTEREHEEFLDNYKEGIVLADPEDIPENGPIAGVRILYDATQDAKGED